MTTTNERHQVARRQLPGFVNSSLVASLHRRAAEGALLRDRRVELAIDRAGCCHVRIVDGVRLGSKALLRKAG